MLKADSGKESDYLHRGEDPHMERPDMRKGMILTAIIILLGPLALFALPSTVTFKVTTNIALINQIQIKGVAEGSTYGSSFTFNFSELSEVNYLHIAYLNYTTNVGTGVNLGIIGGELTNDEGNVIPYTLVLGESEPIKVGYEYPTVNNPSTTIPTPSPLAHLYTTTAPVYLTIPGNVKNYPAGSYTGTITFTLKTK